MMEGIMFGTYTWEQLFNWYLALPAYGQILCLFAAFAIIACTIALVYYIIKGTVYLVYYVLKGVIYLVVLIFYGIYWLFESLYCAITGEERPSKNWKLFKKDKSETKTSEEIVKKSITPVISKKELTPEISFCHDCGSKLTETMKQHLLKDGVAFCPHCGKGFKASSSKIEG